MGRGRGVRRRGGGIREVGLDLVGVQGRVGLLVGILCIVRISIMGEIERVIHRGPILCGFRSAVSADHLVIQCCLLSTQKHKDPSLRYMIAVHGGYNFGLCGYCSPPISSIACMSRVE